MKFLLTKDQLLEYIFISNLISPHILDSSTRSIIDDTSISSIQQTYLIQSCWARNCRSGNRFQESISIRLGLGSRERIARKAWAMVGKKIDATGCNELDGKLVDGGGRGRKSENEWRVVVRSDMCTWHASNACLPPRSLSLPPSMGHSCDPLPSPPPLGLRPTSRDRNTRKLWSRDRSIAALCFFRVEQEDASGWQRVLIVFPFLSFFFFFKARSNCPHAHLAHLRPDRLGYTCVHYLFLFRNFSSGVVAICRDWLEVTSI